MARLPSLFGRPGARILFACLAGVLGVSSVAQASGPTERIQQVLPHPSDPSRVVVRYGMATSGYLYSTDGGRTFRAMCSTLVAPGAKGTDRVRKISQRSIPSTAANAIDTQGRITFAQYPSGSGGLFSDDGTGCTWSSDPFFKERWAFGLQADPAAAGVLWAAVSDAIEETPPVLKLEIARRDAAGTWKVVAPIVPPITGQGMLDGNLLAATHQGKTRLYVTATLVDATGASIPHVYVSDDEGRTWTDNRLPAAQDSLALLAVDPKNADRVVAGIWRDGEPDELLISENRGRSFSTYPGRPAIRALSGVTFDARGRFLVGDQGDGVGEDVDGGVWVASSIGAPLTQATGTSYVDCLHYRALDDTLYACSYDKLTTLNPDTFEAKELVRLESVTGLLECPGRDLVQECQEQFNEGAAWCCAGHFPFTPFCASYDVTVLPNGRRVFCGLAGREYERPGSTTMPDEPGGDDDDETGAPGTSGDAGDDGDGTRGSGERPKSSSGGCALSGDAEGGLASLLGVFLLFAARTRKRAQRREPLG